MFNEYILLIQWSVGSMSSTDKFYFTLDFNNSLISSTFMFQQFFCVSSFSRDINTTN